ncbi:metallophosphoesterase family protein [Spirilliplanes yamanashiensis]|uniref:Metallophosphoesterase n=1 Tax=Spirilliplanes yamanashiensis TaxID=42233 RepID=A0A8J3YBT8_9ACTN|nr:metallophosphoesterase family protein [Spirilliplanes yamanashiensis]MDP9818193.1 putative phosphodiesterase [Spirilliplanes yamanashiensis]GIJ05004.1 metallophosphoesterase [Spirilliplanes yamanashiensis]
MRYGIIADVHANAYALRTALDRLTAAGVDALLCAGDVVGYGAQPDECVALIAERDAHCVAGNHELLVLGRLDPGRAGRLARETTPWTRAALSPDARAYLAALPRVVQLPGLTLAHGAPADPTTYVREPAQARRELAELRRTGTPTGTLVLGHTHRPWLFGAATGTVPAPPGDPVALPPDDLTLVNPGSVGQSRQAERDPLARFALLDVGRRRVRFFAEPYDVPAAVAALRRHGLPRACLHVPPGPWRAVPRRAATLLRGAGRAVRAARAARAVRG